MSDAQPKPTILSISAPKYQLQHISASGCEGDLLNVYETSRPSGASQTANKFFGIKVTLSFVEVIKKNFFS